MTKHLRLLLPVLALYLAGCPSPEVRVRHAKPFPDTVALLPMDNHSNSLIGPVLLRKLIEDLMAGSSVDVQDTKETDAILRKAGITEGGQLRSIPPEQLGKLLGVEGLIYGELLDFNYTNIGVISKRSVKARLFIIDPATGEKLWDATKQEANSRTAFSADGMKENLAVGLGTKLVETAMQSPLRPETETVARELLGDLRRAKKSW